jgi:tRNA threonylcarbamoyladenosine biosynthesis protein TsaB
MLLAIDTATQMASLALYDQGAGRVLGEEAWHSVNNHTVELMPRLVRLLRMQGVSPNDLTGLPVSIGPGSFTGLRIGLGVAKGLALARGLPVAGIPTLDIVAQPHMAQRLPIWAIVRAGRGRICIGQFAQRKGHWYQRGSTQLTTLDGLCDQVEGPALFCGEIEAPDRDLIFQRLGTTVSIASPASSVRRAAYLAELGWKRLAQGDADDAATLSPIYLHDSRLNA